MKPGHHCLLLSSPPLHSPLLPSPSLLLLAWLGLLCFWIMDFSSAHSRICETKANPDTSPLRLSSHRNISSWSAFPPPFRLVGCINNVQGFGEYLARRIGRNLPIPSSSGTRSLTKGFQMFIFPLKTLILTQYSSTHLQSQCLGS